MRIAAGTRFRSATGAWCAGRALPVPRRSTLRPATWLQIRTHRAGPLDANHGPWNRGPTIHTTAGRSIGFTGLQALGGLISVR